MQLALVPLLVAAILPSFGDGPFLELSFGAALAQARQSEKVVFVDFFTTWCGPCKKLDQITWKDAEVVAWLEEHTVPLKIDAEKQVELAKRYEVAAYPTLVFIDPDGELRATLVGYHTPELFLVAAPDALAGIKPSDSKREALSENPNDWRARTSLADALVEEQQYEEALEHYLWCFDHGVEHNVGYDGVRVSFLLADLKSLGREYPPALEAMRRRRDAAEEGLLADSSASAATRDFCALNRELGDRERSLEMYERLVEADGLVDLTQSVDRRVILFDACIDLLVKQERYRDIINGFGNVRAWLDQQDARVKEYAEYLGAADPENEHLARMRGMTVTKAAKLYRALASVEGEDERLLDLEQALIEFDPVLKTWSMLMHAARRAGRRDLQERLRKTALEQLPEEQHRKIPRVRG